MTPESLDRLELEDLQLSPDLFPKPAAPGEKFPQWPKGKGFHYYRFTPESLESLAEITKAPWLIVMLVLYRLWYKNSGHNPVRLTTESLRKFDLSPHQKSYALKQLQKAGCIAIERKKGKNPRITLNWFPGRVPGKDPGF